MWPFLYIKRVGKSRLECPGSYVCLTRYNRDIRYIEKSSIGVVNLLEARVNQKENALFF